MIPLKTLITVINESIGIDIRKRKRKRMFVAGRSIYYYFAIKKENWKVTLNEVGSEVGADHATVINGLKRFQDDFDTDSPLPDGRSFVELYKEIRRRWNICKKSDDWYANLSALIDQQKDLRAQLATVDAQIESLTKSTDKVIS